jgi:hypothetical protein
MEGWKKEESTVHSSTTEKRIRDPQSQNRETEKEASEGGW